MIKRNVLIGMLTTMGFVAGALAAEARHRDCVMVHYKIEEDRAAEILGCIRHEGFHCFEYQAFKNAMEQLELDSYPPKGEEE